MEGDYLTNPMFVLSVLVGASVWILLYFVNSFRNAGEHVQAQDKSKIDKSGAQLHLDKKKEQSLGGKRKKKAAESKLNCWSGKHDKHNYTHPWLLVSLKGHTGNILDMDFSSNGKYLTSCDDVGAVFIWDTKDLSQKDRKSVRVNIEFDHATHVKFSPDSKAFIINKYTDNTVEVYKVEKKKDGWLTASKAFTFPKQHETDIISIDIQRSGKFIITCSNRTDLVIWDLKGQKLAQIDTYLMNNTRAKISPCGKFIAATGFSPEAKIWEVFFDNTGELKDVKSIKELTLGGHTSGVYDVAFDVDSSHMATVSKDGTWRLYDTKVSYKLGENARFLKSGNYERSGNNALIALSPDAQVIAIATGADVALYTTRNNRLDYVLENIYFDKITSMMFDSTGRFLLTAGDKQIRVFHNVTGYRSNIANAEEKLKENITSATRERLQALIGECRDFLKGVENF